MLKMLIKTLFSALALASLVSSLFAKEVKDYHGRVVQIPDHPQRIASLHPAMAIYIAELDLLDRLVASTAHKRDGKLWVYLVSEYWDIDFEKQNIVHLGDGMSVDIEAVKRSKPDLVVTYPFTDLKTLESVSKIAPTIAVGTDDVGYRQFASWLGQADVYDVKHAEYLKKVAKVKQLFKPEDLQGKTYAYLYPEIKQNNFALILKGGAIQKVSEDLGLTRLSSMEKLMGQQYFSYVSPEAIDQLDADYLMVTYFNMKTLEDDALGKKTMDTVVPGWDSFMKAAQNDRVMYADFAKAHMAAFVVYDLILEKYKTLAKSF